jgi:hypothetical protein
MLPSYIGNRDPGPRGLLHDPKLLVDGIPSTALNTRINLNSFCIRRHSRMTRLTPSSYLRQHCPVEIGAAPEGVLRLVVAPNGDNMHRFRPSKPTSSADNRNLAKLSRNVRRGLS